MKGERTTHLKISTLGDFRVEADGREVTPRSEAGRLLLAILTLSSHRQESRARLAAMLWEEASEQQARARLRQALYRFRTELGPAWDGLAVNPTAVALTPNVVQSDVDSLETALRAGEVPEALLSSGELSSALLVSLPEPGQLYASWLAIRRQALENRLREALIEIVRAGKAHDRAARALLSLDPSDEFAARHLIGHYAREGDTGRALKVYSELWDHLDETYGMEPSQPTQELIAAVKKGEVATTPAASPPAMPTRLAVREVTMPGQGGEARQLADLFRAELIGWLSRFREFEVIDAALGDGAPAEFGLRMTASEIAGRARIRLTLARERDGRVLWSDEHDEVSARWSDRLAAVAGSVAAACSLSISRARLFEIRRAGTSKRALDHWLVGQMLLDEFRATSWDEAAEEFRRAIELDSEFSGAYSSLSQVHNISHLVHPGMTPDPEVLAESRDLANRAIALDPGDSRAHLCRAWAAMLTGAFDRAESAFADALDCNPNDPWTVISCALGAAFGGDQARADTLAGRVLEERWTHAPSVWGYHATIRFLGGDYDGCVEAAANAGDSILNIPGWEAAAHFRRGRAGQAAAAWARFEAAARAHWAGEGEPTTERLLDWLKRSFPIRSHQTLKLLRENATGAARAYLHCMQE